MAIRTVLKFDRLASEPPLPSTDQGMFSVYYILDGILDVGTIYGPQRGGLKRYFGNLADLPLECGLTPPETGKPIWNNTTPAAPDYQPGKPFRFFVPFSAITPAAGTTVAGINGKGLPGFLAVFLARRDGDPNGEPGVSVYGDVPDNQTGLLPFGLSAYGSDGKFADRAFVSELDSTPAPDVPIKTLIQFQAGQSSFIYRESPLQTSPATISISGPAGWTDTGTHLLQTGSGDNIDGTVYPYYCVFTGAVPGTYIITRISNGKTTYGTFTLGSADQVITVPFTATAPGNQSNYTLGDPITIQEGSSATLVLRKIEGAQSNPVDGSTYDLVGNRTGTAINAATVSVADNDNPLDSYQCTGRAKLNGVVVAQVLINIADRTPYIISILHQYNPSNQTDYLLLKHSLQNLNTSTQVDKIPVWRCKRKEEANWRGSFISMYSTQGIYSQYNGGYQLYMQANLTSAGVAQTNGVVQFKPYPSAPDSSIITIEFGHNAGTPQDFGTEVYNIGGTGSTGGNLETNIVFTGENVSDAPSTNPAIMNVIATKNSDTTFSIVINYSIQPNGGDTRYILVDTLGFLTIAEAQARSYPLGRPVLFQGYDMAGSPDESKRSDAKNHASQSVTLL